jgi:hypothetical protein
VNHAINTITSIITLLFGLVMEAIGAVDAALAALMTSAGLPPNVQVIVLIVVAILLIVFAIRVLGGVFGVLLIILLILLVMHRLMPGMQLQHAALPAGQAQAGQQL